MNDGEYMTGLYELSHFRDDNLITPILLQSFELSYLGYDEKTVLEKLQEQYLPKGC